MNILLNNRFIRSRFLYACLGTMAVVGLLIMWFRRREQVEQDG